MRILPVLLLVGASPNWAGDAFGVWRAETLTVRFEPHAKGEVFTLDQTDRDGRSTTTSTILYFDSQPREFRGFACSGTQSSRRVDSQTVEILRTCAGGVWTRYIRRLSPRPKELVLEITEQQPSGRRVERRVVLEKQ